MRSELAVVHSDYLTSQDTVTMSSKDVADVLNMKHYHVLRDIKCMFIEVVGGEKFLSNKVTGGLSLKAYTHKNYDDLFNELMAEIDKPNLVYDSNHELLEGFICKRSPRGDVAEFHMNGILVHAFAARKDNVTAYKLVSRLNFLEKEARKRELEAITKRVENIYRVKEIPFDEMSHSDIQKMFSKLDDSQRRVLVANISPRNLGDADLEFLLKRIVSDPSFYHAVGNAMSRNQDDTQKQVEDMKEVPRGFLPEPTNNPPVKTIRRVINPENVDIDFLRSIYSSMRDNQNMSIEECASFFGITNYTLWNTLYKKKFLKNGLAPTMNNFTTYNKNHHQEPYSTYADKGYFFLKEYKVGTTKYQTRITKGGFKYLVKKLLGMYL